MVDLGGRRLSASDVQDLLSTDHPMVERFRLEKQEEVPGRRLRFALVIVPRRGVRYRQMRDEHGRRIDKPPWRTLTGEEQIGQGNRLLWTDDGEPSAENLTFFPNPMFNDLGIGSALYVSMERLYRALGVRRVTLLAVEVGTYAWARQGFSFLEPGLAAELAGRLELFLFSHKLPCAVETESLHEPWDLANFDLPGHEIDDDRVGKAFMLDGASRWHGIKDLGDPVQSTIAEQSRRETFARLPDKIEGASADLRVR